MLINIPEMGFSEGGKKVSSSAIPDLSMVLGY